MRDYLKTRHIRQAGGDLYVKTSGLGLFNERPRIGAISPQLFEPGETCPQFGQQPTTDSAIVVVGFADKGFEHQPFGVYDHMALAPFDFLAAIVASYAPFSVVLTDWLSILPALGVLSRPSCRRSCSRSAAFIRAHVPSLRQVLK